MDDLISRQSAIDAIYEHEFSNWCDKDEVSTILFDLPSAENAGKWIPCSERLPDDIKPVIVTWKNTDPKSYYQYIVGKHYTGVACYKSGRWYWYSSTTEDILAEYGRYDLEEFDEAIECIAWMQLPEPYKEKGKRIRKRERMMDKQKAISLLRRIQDPEPYEPQITEDAYYALEMGINALEEQKKGKWVQHPWSRMWDVCSVCGIGCKRREYGVQDGHEWMMEESYRFCPHCGAEMEGEER